ncbi:hypothetical protein CDJ58_07070 [Campylobacter lari]|nr:hypothetical protein [Campylobacter lari]EAK5749150.1 hypothetical protein [Campylobacter lari]EAK9878345.1 hypothetical protein [Campylobacter lari]
MKKYLFCLFFFLNFYLYAYEPDHKSFKDGFNAGISALKFQSEIDGFTSKIIEVQKTYSLIYDIKNIPLNEALFLQLLSSREGYKTHLTKDYIYFGSYDREIDTKEKMNMLITKFNLELKNFKIEKELKRIVTYPFLYDSFYNKLLEDAKLLGVLVVTEVVEKKININNKNKSNKKNIEKKIKTFTLNNSKAMSYYLINNNDKESKNYLEKDFIKSSGNFKIDKYTKTNTNEEFVKVLGENIYFSTKDIKED